jgi:hypothetical protein
MLHIVLKRITRRLLLVQVLAVTALTTLSRHPCPHDTATRKLDHVLGRNQQRCGGLDLVHAPANTRQGGGTGQRLHPGFGDEPIILLASCGDEQEQ